MKAWQFQDTGIPLELVDWPEPEPGPGEVVIDIRASGLCFSDVSAVEEPSWSYMFPTRPVILGHEPAGVISELGSGVTEFAIGDRVSIPSGYPPGIGYARNGAYAEKLVAPTQYLVRIPDRVSFVEAAAGADSGNVAHHAVVAVGQVQPGERVGIIGIGGLGQIGLRIAHLRGAEVYVATRNCEVWPIAEAAGAKRVVSDITELADVGLDVVIDFAGFEATTAGTIEVLGRGGRLILVGLGQWTASVDIGAVVTKELKVLGSEGGGVEDLAAVFELYAQGLLKPVLTEIAFSEIGEGLERLKKGGVRGRLVAVLP
ncbi:zinc-binding dehydrogenase [Nocardia sp. 348MFTsu5.1]|uniref:zinc-binding dehydrogenase n=1 Tax=Nocardia sp. 348MFTsu5.1 TaxID=1172185 RepID=UPI00037128EC|nr:zinc-binding dehydrogenase [Nocardia sp. 348MFTsu5.1]